MTVDRSTWGTQALSRAKTGLLGSAFLLASVGLVVTLLTVWPLIGPLPDGLTTRTWEPFGLFTWEVSPDIAMILVVLVASALGSFVHAATSFSTYVGNRTLHGSWVWWYLLRVSIGASLALLVYFVIRGGLFSGTATPDSTNPYGIAAIAGLSGMFSKHAADKLEEIFDTALGTKKGKGDEERRDKVTDRPTEQASPLPVIGELEPPSGLVGASDVRVWLVGGGFLPETSVWVRRRGTDEQHAAASQVSRDGSSRMQVQLPADLMQHISTLEIFAENPGGRRSEVRSFAVKPIPESRSHASDGGGQPSSALAAATNASATDGSVGLPSSPGT